MTEKLNIICVTYKKSIALRLTIDSFLLQTNPNWKLNIIHDGPPEQDTFNIINQYNDSRINFEYSEQRVEFWGQPNMLKKLNEIDAKEGEYILITNGDSYYIPSFVEKILSNSKFNIGMMYYDTLHSHYDYQILQGKLKINHIDIGSFVVKHPIGKNVGFRKYAYAADGQFAEDCAEYCANNNYRTYYIPRCMYVHT